MVKRLVVSHTKLSTLESCPQNYKRKYLDRMEPRKRPIYFTFGSAVHKYLELYYNKQPQSKCLDAAKLVFNEVDRGPLNATEINDLECQIAMVMGICETYPEFYQQDFLTYPKMVSELSLWAKDGLDIYKDGEYVVTYEGQLDGLWQDAAGDWWIFETKTAAPQTITQGYLDKVHIDSQVLGYMHLAKHYIGEFPKGIIYNIIKKPAIRLKKGETHQAFRARIKQEYTVNGVTKQYFIRHQPEISRANLDNWLMEKEIEVKNLLNLHTTKSKIWPKHTGSCNIKFGTCQYLPVCMSGIYNRLLFTKRKPYDKSERAAQTKATREKKTEIKG